MDTTLELGRIMQEKIIRFKNGSWSTFGRIETFLNLKLRSKLTDIGKSRLAFYKSSKLRQGQLMLQLINAPNERHCQRHTISIEFEIIA